MVEYENGDEYLFYSEFRTENNIISIMRIDGRWIDLNGHYIKDVIINEILEITKPSKDIYACIMRGDDAL